MGQESSIYTTSMLCIAHHWILFVNFVNNYKELLAHIEFDLTSNVESLFNRHGGPNVL